MSPGLAWTLQGLALLVLLLHRRTLAVCVVAAQTLLLAAIAVHDAGDTGDLSAAGALAFRALALTVVFLFLINRTRDPHPVQPRTSPLRRVSLALALALALNWLVPTIGLDSRQTERAVLALAAFGLVLAATSRGTLFQVLGVVLVENGLALAALQLPGTSWLIELGAAFDLILIALVAGVFHERIFAEFGAGDAGVLRSLHD